MYNVSLCTESTEHNELLGAEEAYNYCINYRKKFFRLRLCHSSFCNFMEPKPLQEVVLLLCKVNYSPYIIHPTNNPVNRDHYNSDLMGLKLRGEGEREKP